MGGSPGSNIMVYRREIQFFPARHPSRNKNIQNWGHIRRKYIVNESATAEEYNNMTALIKLTAEMEEISQNFERKLFSTGGSLNLKKCFWYLISWRWEENGSATMVRREQSPGEIYMTQGYKLAEKAQIYREECDTAKRTLGWWINPPGKMTHTDPKIQIEYAVKLGQA